MKCRVQSSKDGWLIRCNSLIFCSKTSLAQSSAHSKLGMSRIRTCFLNLSLSRRLKSYIWWVIHLYKVVPILIHTKKLQIWCYFEDSRIQNNEIFEFFHHAKNQDFDLLHILLKAMALINKNCQFKFLPIYHLKFIETDQKFY